MFTMQKNAKLEKEVAEESDGNGNGNDAVETQQIEK